MKISILLPYKENFSPIYPGAVSLFVNDTVNVSKFKKNITVYGNTDFKRIFKSKYYNIPLSKLIFGSQSKRYIKEFSKIEQNNKSDLIEIHNRPNYLHALVKYVGKRNYILYFHNDPLTMTGSKSLTESAVTFLNSPGSNFVITSLIVSSKASDPKLSLNTTIIYHLLILLHNHQLQFPE